MVASMLQVALSCAARGFRVFPLGKGSKIPLLSGWPVLATTDEATIRQWWSGSFETKSKEGRVFRIPESANVGICPGEDFVIIDVDTDVAHGSSGVAELQRLVAEGLPRTLTIKTPSGGLHLYYKHPAGSIEVQGCDTTYVKSTASWRREKSGIDIRGNKGQGVAPGSLIGGIPYTVATSTAPVELPFNIAKQLPFKKAFQASTDLDHLPEHLRSLNLASDDSLEIGTSKFSELPKSIPLGARDSTLFANACSWRERGYPIDHANALMRDLFLRCEQGDDPITVEDALAKVTRAYESYTPTPGNGDWTTMVGDDDTIVEAPSHQVANLKAALTRFIYIEGGDRVADTSRHPSLAVLKLNEFKNSFKNIKFDIPTNKKGKQEIDKVPLPTVWLASKFRRTVRDVGYQPLPPGAPASDTYTLRGEEFYNTWIGSTLEIPETLDKSKVAVFFDHMDYIFEGDPKAKKHFTDWLCYTVKYPSVRIKHAVLLIGATGIGKGWIYLLMQKLLGSQNVNVVKNKDLDSSFNTWISEVTLAVIDDVVPTQSRMMWESVKSDITEAELEINRKYGGKGKERVFANVLAFSNFFNAIATITNDRRLWVHNTMVARKSDEYYINLFKWLETDGPAHLLKSIMLRDLSHFNPGALPVETEAKRRMINAHRSLIEEIIFDAVEDKQGCFEYDIVSAELVERFVQTHLNLDRLDPKDKYKIRTILSALGGPLLQDRYRVPGRVGALRLRCVRSHDKWATEPVDKVVAEYGAALNASITGPRIAIVPDVEQSK